jgi:hypothetical protein
MGRDDCAHEHTYYDEKGERCKDCGYYVRRARKVKR